MAIDSNWLDNAVSGATEQRNDMITSQKYYDSENTAIMSRTMKIYNPDDPTQTMTDPYKSNYQLPSGYHKLLVEQKVNYSLNDSMTAMVGETDISNYIGMKWKRKIQEAGREASINGFSVWQFYMEGSEVKYKAIPSEQIILCFDGDSNVYKVIRLYEKPSENGKTIQVSEVWDDEKHWYYEKSDSKDWECTKPEGEYHLVTQATLGDNVVSEEGTGWGRVPFAIFFNNQSCDTDLKPVKPFIDAYDFTNADFGNNLADFQEAYWSLKNFDGQDIGEFFDMVKKYKAIKVGDGGDASMHTMDVPHEAKTVFLDRVKGDIFLFGMGVNTIDMEGNVTNVRIKSMYSNLDLKANTFELNCTSFIEQALFFYKVKEDNIVVTYDRNMIMNNVELSDLANRSINAVSEETRLSNDPRVKDVTAEIEMMEQTRSSALDLDEDDEQE